MTTDLKGLLDSYHTNTLRQIAEAGGINLKDARGKNLPKDKLHEVMIRDFFTNTRVSASYAKLNELEKAVLNRILLRQGETPSRSLKRELIRAKLVTSTPEPEEPPARNRYYAPSYKQEIYEGSPDRPDSNIFEDVLSRLTYFGLVFSTRLMETPYSTATKLRYQPGLTLIIPNEIRRHLPEPEPVEAETFDWIPARTVGEDPNVFLRDLYLYWDFARRTPLELIQSGFVGKRFLKAVNTQLLQPDKNINRAKREDEMPQLYRLRTILQSLNLLYLDGKSLSAKRPDMGQIPDFWESAPTWQVHTCIEAWLNSGIPLKRDLVIDRYGPNYVSAYRAVLEQLQQAPAEAWLAEEEILHRVQDANMDFLIPIHSHVAQHRGQWYSNYSAQGYISGYTSNLLGDLEKAEGQFLDQCLRQDLFQFGLVEIGYQGDEIRPYAVRLSEFGRAVLATDTASSVKTPPMPDSGKLIIQPNFEILALGPVSLAVLAYLDLIAARQQADLGAFAYQLTRDSIYQAQQADLNVADIVQWLVEQSGQPLPQNVERSLQEWGAHHERIVFRTGITLLQAANADTLHDLMQAPQISSHIARSVSDMVALINDEQADDLVQALLDAEILPALGDADVDTADQSVIIEPDGTIVPIHAVPSLHLQGLLTRFAESGSDGHWHLTKTSVEQAGGTKQKVEDMLTELNKLQRGALPADLIDQIKAWGGYYGQAATETLTLIEFRDQEILAELLDHPDLKAHLTPFPTDNRALAVITKKSLTHVKKTLTGLGIPVASKLTDSPTP